jgi:serine/threonine protein kinase
MMLIIFTEEQSLIYVPPELIYVENDIAIVKSVYEIEVQENEEEKDFEYEAIYEKIPYLLVPASPAHDIWALGLVLYELCTGKKFFIQVTHHMINQPIAHDYGDERINQIISTRMICWI